MIIMYQQQTKTLNRGSKPEEKRASQQCDLLKLFYNIDHK